MLSTMNGRGPKPFPSSSCFEFVRAYSYLPNCCHPATHTSTLPQPWLHYKTKPKITNYEQYQNLNNLIDNRIKSHLVSCGRPRMELDNNIFSLGELLPRCIPETYFSLILLEVHTIFCWCYFPLISLFTHFTSWPLPPASGSPPLPSPFLVSSCLLLCEGYTMYFHHIYRPRVADSQGRVKWQTRVAVDCMVQSARGEKRLLALLTKRVEWVCRVKS